MDEPRFEFRYELTAEDVAAATKWAILEGPRSGEYLEERQRAGRTLLTFTFVLLAAAAAVFTFDAATTRPPAKPGGFAISLLTGLASGFFILYWILFSPRANRRAIANAIRNEIARESGQAMLGPTVARFDAEGCAFDRSLGESLRRWPGVLECVETDAMIYTTTLDQQILGLPTRVFRDDAHRGEFLAALRRWIDTRGAAALGRVTAYLREHDLPCPACGYNLRGVTVMVCPECAASLARVVLPEGQTPGPGPAAAGSTAPAPPTPPR
jgi:hypothetical protein